MLDGVLLMVDEVLFIDEGRQFGRGPRG